eukprot:COSAG06_NODE_1420_length_9514_cov_3.400106_4_plen_318_part_00
MAQQRWRPPWRWLHGRSKPSVNSLSALRLFTDVEVEMAVPEAAAQRAMELEEERLTADAEAHTAKEQLRNLEQQLRERQAFERQSDKYYTYSTAPHLSAAKHCWELSTILHHQRCGLSASSPLLSPHYHEPTCMGHEADYGASLQHLMNAVFTQDFDTSLDDMTDDGAVIQFTYPHKFKNGQCYPIMQLDLSHLQGGAKDPINLATKYHFRGCPAPGGGGGDTPGTGGGDTPTPPPPPAATCDEHMVTVLSAQVTTSCCPPFDPNCGIPDTCSPRCAPVFNNFYDSCQSFIDGVELAAFHDKCTAAGGAAGGGGRGR